MKQDLSTIPHPVVKKVFQLDKDLIKKINNLKDGYRIDGTVVDYSKENNNEKVNF